MKHFYVLCEVEDGLLEGEVSATVRGASGETESFRAARDTLVYENDQVFVNVGYVQADTHGNRALVQLPSESDSGRHRMWVPSASLIAKPFQVFAS